MEEEWRSSQLAMQEDVDAIILVHPTSHLQKILMKICGKLIGSFVLLDEKSDIESFCNGDGTFDIDIRQIIDSFLVFTHEITIDRLVRGGVLPCVASKRLLLLHIRFCYNFSIMLSVRTKKLLCDVSAVTIEMRSRRKLELLLNLDASDKENDVVEVPPPFLCIEEQSPPEPLERITDQDPGLYLLDMLERSGARRRHLLQDYEPVRPVELKEPPMFGMPTEYLWDEDAIINWLPEDLRPSSLFPQVVEPQQVNNVVLPPPPPLPPSSLPDEEPEPEARPSPPPRVRRIPATEDVLNRVTGRNHLDQFLKNVLRKRTRDRDSVYKNHLKMLQEELRKEEMVQPTPIDKRPCPFSTEEIQEFFAQLPELPFHVQLPLTGESILGRTMASDLSARIEHFPVTPDLQGAAELQDTITPHLQPQPDIDMEPALIENIVPAADGVLLQFILPENVADESLGVQPLPVVQTPQPELPTLHPDEPIQGVEEPQDNIDVMMQNLFQEPTDAALIVSLRVGDTSFVHTLPTHEQVIGTEAVQPGDNIAGRLRPVRTRRLVFQESPPTSPPRRKRRKRRQTSRTPAAAAANGNATDANVAPHPMPDADFDDLGVMPFEPPTEEQQVPVGGYGPMFLDTSEEIRELKFVDKLRELQTEHGDVLNFLQICPYESTLRTEAAIIFRMLIDLCHAKQIQLIQEVAYVPEKLFVKILNLENTD